MAEMIIGLFKDKDGAEDAIDELHTEGFEAKDISVVAREDTKMVHEGATDATSGVAEGAISGATTGGVIGGLAGLLIGIGAIAIPGGLLIGGPLAAALGLTGAAATTVSGAATGALAGGIVGALVGLGIPEEEARYYEEGVNEGGIVIAVPAGDRNVSEVRAILEDNGAERVRTFNMEHERKRAVL